MPQVIKMLAAVYHGTEDVRLEEVPVPEIKEPTDVLFTSKACGICGSELRVLHAPEPFAKKNIVWGHEIGGVVTEVGEAVEKLKPGDRITVDPEISCGECYYCRAQQKNMCENMVYTGWARDGAYAKYCVLPSKALYKVPNDMPLEDAALTEPIACALSAIERAKVKPGDTVAILGAGPIGIEFLQVLKNYPIERIVITDITEKRVEIAEKMGDSIKSVDVNVVNSRKENPIEAIRKITGGKGADVIIDAAPSTIALEQAMEMVRPAGTVLVFAILPMTSKVSFSPYPFVWQHVNLLGHFTYCHDTWNPAINLLYNGKIDTKQLITHKFPLEGLFEGFKLMDAGDCFKVEIIP
jgi:threonine dehydrogenase-like Zn-dependent dehydrogenase